jgi:hypothetical protein
MTMHAMRQWTIGVILAAATWASTFAADAAAVPQVIAHEGELADANGQPLRGLTRTTFKLYDGRSGGRALWSETVEVEFDDGYFSVWLGEGTPLDDSLLDGSTRWLGIAVGSGPERPVRAAVASTTHPMFAEGDDVEGPEVDRLPIVTDDADTADTADTAEVPAMGFKPPWPQRRQSVVLDAAHADAVLGPLLRTAEYAFIGASLHMDVEPWQVVRISARAGLGSTARGGADGLDLSICARKAGSSRLIDNPEDRLLDLRVAENRRDTFTVKTRFEKLDAGDYEFGLCGRVRGASRWNDNDTSRVAVLLATP